MSVSTEPETQKALAQRKLGLDDLLKKQNSQEADLDVLLRKLEKLKVNVEQAKAEYAEINNTSFSPILQFPIEITIFIFEQVYGLDERNEIALSRVCQSWRSITLTTPKLWSRFLYHLSEETLKAHEAELQRLSVYLERSGNHLLDLRFLQPMWLENMTPTVVSLLEKATTHAMRWRYFSLELVHKPSLSKSWIDEKALDMLSGLVNITSQNLRLFEVILPTKFTSPRSLNTRWIPTSQTSAICEPDVCFSRMDIQSISCCPPPFCITSLQLASTPGGPLLRLPWLVDFLCATTYSLINLTVESGCIAVESRFPTRRLMAETLKTCHCEDIILGTFLSKFVYAPKLDSLILGDVLYTRFAMLGISSDDFPMSSFPSLRSLALMNCRFVAPSALQSLVVATKSARDIFILYADNLNTMIHDQPPAEAILWPNMASLTCSFSNELDDYAFKLCRNFIDEQSKTVSDVTVRLFQEDALRWGAEDPVSWKSLQTSGRLKELGAKACSNILDHMEWRGPRPSTFW